MNEKTKTPIETLVALLAEMTERATEAERQIDAAKEESSAWAGYYLDECAKSAELKSELEAQRKENEELRSSISGLIEKIENGDKENE